MSWRACKGKVASRIVLVAALLLASLSVSETVGAQTPVTYDGIEFPQGDISFADRVVNFTGAEGVLSPYDNPAAALGAPDYSSSAAEGTHVALGNAQSQCQTSLTLEFVDNYLVDVDGDDLWIFEVGPAVEATELFISTDGANWIGIGKIEGATRGVDISTSVTPGQRFPFVRLCDFPDGTTSGSPFAGPDIDAVGAIGSVFRPSGERDDPADAGSGTSDSGASDTGTATGPGGTTSAPPPFGTPEPAVVSRMTIQAGQRQVVPGGQVWVPVHLLRSDDVANINFEITFDTGVAVANGDPVGGNLVGGRLFTANPGDPGIIRVGFAGTDGVFGTGTVTWIPFRAVGLPGQRTVLSVTVSAINQPDGTVPLIDRIEGSIIITDEDGLVPGDCDGNGYLTEFDAFCALQMSVQLRPVLLSLDLNDDGQVTSRDATLILQRVTGSG
jgi:hypothetical protein